MKRTFGFYGCWLLTTLVVLLTSTLMPSTMLSQTASTIPSRHVIICVDGVGVSTINKMRAEGHFKMFHSPSHMISTFPSLTNAALSKILEPAGAGMTGGYEDNFFDTESNRMRGGILDRFRSDHFIRGTFRELFDYHPSAIKSGLGYATPPLSTYLESLSDLIRLRQKARSSQQPVFFAYTGATDSLAHVGGEPLLRNFLSRLDDTLANGFDLDRGLVGELNDGDVGELIPGDAHTVRARATGVVTSRLLAVDGLRQSHGVAAR